jgi:hypothetical protein
MTRSITRRVTSAERAVASAPFPSFFCITFVTATKLFALYFVLSCHNIKNDVAETSMNFFF